MVGLFIPGIREIILSRESLGAFSKTYLLLFPACTALILKSNLSTIAIFALERLWWLINIASEENTFSTSFSPFIINVDPELTISQIPSANPILGAISTDPLISWISALMLFFFR